jgi:hypothetical protein
MEKKKLDYNYNYDLVLKDKDKILKEFDYPYIKYIYSSRKIIRNFKRLIRIKHNIINKDFFIPFINVQNHEKYFNGKHNILVNNNKDYEKVDMISDYFNEECRVTCRFFRSKGSIYDYYHNYFNKIIEYMKRNNLKITLKNIRETIWKYSKKENYGECSTFRPKTMKYFIDLFKARKILDISSGWGDRLLGAMASDIDCYHGFDPNPCLHSGYNKMINFFKDYVINKNAEFIIKELPFEKAELQDNYYDLVMSSPPYFDIEIYVNDPRQSVHNNKSEKYWYDKYLTVWINKCLNALKIDGILALNINQFKHHYYVNWLLDDMRKNNNWKFLGIIGYANSEKINKKNINVQPVFIWKKI